MRFTALIFIVLYCQTVFADDGIDPRTSDVLPYDNAVELTQEIYEIVLYNMRATGASNKQISEIIDAYQSKNNNLLIERSQIEGQEKDEYTVLKPVFISFSNDNKHNLDALSTSKRDGTNVSVPALEELSEDSAVKELVEKNLDSSTEILGGCFKGFDKELIQPVSVLSKIALEKLAAVGFRALKDAGDFLPGVGDLLFNRVSSTPDLSGIAVAPASENVFAEALRKAREKLESDKMERKNVKISPLEIDRATTWEKNKKIWEEELRRYSSGNQKYLDHSKLPFFQDMLNQPDPELLFDIFLASLAVKENNPGMSDEEFSKNVCGGIAFIGAFFIPVGGQALKLGEFALWLEKILPILNKSERFAKYISKVKTLKAEEIAEKFSTTVNEAEKLAASLKMTGRKLEGDQLLDVLQTTYKTSKGSFGGGYNIIKNELLSGKIPMSSDGYSKLAHYIRGAQDNFHPYDYITEMTQKSYQLAIEKTATREELIGLFKEMQKRNDLRAVIESDTKKRVFKSFAHHQAPGAPARDPVGDALMKSFREKWLQNKGSFKLGKLENFDDYFFKTKDGEALWETRFWD